MKALSEIVIASNVSVVANDVFGNKMPIADAANSGPISLDRFMGFRVFGDNKMSEGRSIRHGKRFRSGAFSDRKGVSCPSCGMTS